METQINTGPFAAGARRSVRVRTIALLGPLTVFGGVLWALAQPYRITLLHPRGQGFWWLLVEPPLLVIGIGVFFAYAIARPLIEDMEGHSGTPG